MVDANILKMNEELRNFKVKLKRDAELVSMPKHELTAQLKIENVGGALIPNQPEPTKWILGGTTPRMARGSISFSAGGISFGTTGFKPKRQPRKGIGFYRHGDLAIIPITHLPSHVTEHEGNILEYGEASGHAHKLDGQEIQIFNNRDFVEIKEPTPLVHEEHDTIVLPRGLYEVRRQHEYKPYDRAVMDVLD